MEGESDFRPWDELAPDLLGLIFKNLELQEVLEVIPMVCKSWCQLVEGPYCWDKIDINDWSWTNQSMPLKIDRMLQTLIMRSSGSLRELSVSCMNNQMFSFITEHVGSLQTLILESCSISDSIVEQVAPELSSLTTLEISGCDYISTRALEAIGTNCKMLKHLSIDGLEINASTVLDILSGCPELESLDFRGCWGVIPDEKFLEENYPKVKVEGPDPLSGCHNSRECRDDEAWWYDECLGNDWDDWVYDGRDDYGDYEIDLFRPLPPF